MSDLVAFHPHQYLLSSLYLSIYLSIYLSTHTHTHICVYIYIYVCGCFGLHWVFVAACRLSLVVASRGYSSLWHAGSVVVACGLKSAGFIVVAHGLSCSAACGIFPDQGSNPRPLHWQADS